jgi:hypothetical protein
MQAMTATMNSWSEPFVIIIKQLELIRGAKLTIVSCTLFLPIESKELFVVTMNT